MAKQLELTMLCDLPGGIVHHEPSKDLAEAIRKAVIHSNYDQETLASMVDFDPGNFNKLLKNSTKALDALAPLMKITRSDGPITTLAQMIGRKVITEEEYQQLKEAEKERDQLREVIRGAVGVRETV